MEKVLVISDLHIPFIDFSAWTAMIDYAKKYKPNTIVIAGDLVDFYRLSKFDKNPERDYSIQDELDTAREYLKELRSKFPRSHIVYLKGNHENRLQKALWSNIEFYSLRDISLNKLLSLDNLNIEFIDGTYDYWKNNNSHLKLGDMLLMHGDNRLNGAKLSQHAGYSAMNTMKTMLNSVASGHSHRLALVHCNTITKDLVGIETGCLCRLSGTANWQQGFATFEVEGKKSYNHRIHKINKGKLIADGVVYGKRPRKKKK